MAAQAKGIVGYAQQTINFEPVSDLFKFEGTISQWRWGLPVQTISFTLVGVDKGGL